MTTTYTNSTELHALEELAALGADIKVSYDTASTRLHAKAWLFHRNSGYSTAYIGSSNLTHSAMVTGLEWNVRVSGVGDATALAASLDRIQRTASSIVQSLHVDHRTKPVAA